MSESISASVVIPAPPEIVFAFLAHPANHQIFDASETVGETLTPGRIAAVGQVFTMKMTSTDAASVVHHYVTDNHITDFDEGRTIEWAPAPQGRDPWGWRWRYDLEAVHHGDATRVTETHDWSLTSPENIEKFHVPEFTEADLLDSLNLLDLAVISGARAPE